MQKSTTMHQVGIVQQKLVLQQTWHWTLVVPHSTQLLWKRPFSSCLIPKNCHLVSHKQDGSLTQASVCPSLGSPFLFPIPGHSRALGGQGQRGEEVRMLKSECHKNTLRPRGLTCQSCLQGSMLEALFVDSAPVLRTPHEPCGRC